MVNKIITVVKKNSITVIIKWIEVNQLEEHEFLSILKDNLSIQSKWILFTLLQADKQKDHYMKKEKLWEQTNQNYANNEVVKNNDNKTDSILSSRYVLDINTARLEGAGLISFEQVGKTKFYKITEFGKYFLNT